MSEPAATIAYLRRELAEAREDMDILRERAEKAKAREDQLEEILRLANEAQDDLSQRLNGTISQLEAALLQVNPRMAHPIGAGVSPRNEESINSGISISVGCEDCGALYGSDGWCDVIIPDEIWNSLAAGLLCFRCMTRRIVAKGLQDVPVIVASGPYADANEAWRLIGIRHGERLAEAALKQHREGATWAYQLAGAIEMPVTVLDNLSALANGEKPPHDWPYQVDCPKLTRLEAALREAGKALEGIISRVALVSPHYENARAILTQIQAIDSAREAIAKERL